MTVLHAELREAQLAPSLTWWAAVVNETHTYRHYFIDDL